MAVFQTSEKEGSPTLRPLRVATLKGEIWGEVKDMVADLPKWEVTRVDDDGMILDCVRKGGFLGGESKVKITVEGPDGIPSTTVNLTCETSGGMPGLSGDKRVVTEFMRPFHRRVC